jgi:hypothetical protein
MTSTIANMLEHMQHKPGFVVDAWLLSSVHAEVRSWIVNMTSMTVDMKSYNYSFYN